MSREGLGLPVLIVEPPQRRELDEAGAVDAAEDEGLFVLFAQRWPAVFEMLPLEFVAAFEDRTVGPYLDPAIDIDPFNTTYRLRPATITQYKALRAVAGTGFEAVTFRL